MHEHKRISFRERLLGVSSGLALCIVAVPIAVIVTVVMMPFWTWLEAAVAIEAVGHSGPAEWCYLFIYIVVLTCAGFIWSMIRRQRQQRN